jgi:hypothetical protein
MVAGPPARPSLPSGPWPAPVEVVRRQSDRRSRQRKARMSRMKAQAPEEIVGQLHQVEVLIR